MMKKIAVLFIFLISFSFGANAQPPHFDDLVILFADSDYEKLLKKAEKYTQKDKTKNEPLPYMYLSRANFEMSKDAKYADDYPKAFNDAIKYAGKCMRKDEEGLIYEEYREYFTDLKIACVEDLRNLVATDDFNRMRGSIMKLQRFDPDDIGSQYLMVAAQYRIKDKGGARRTLEEANKALENLKSTEDWRSVDFLMLKVGVIEYTKYMVDMRWHDRAKEFIGKFKQWLENDEEFMAFYDQVVNGE